MTARSIDLAAIEPVAVAGGLMLPVRRTLGVTGFGINAYVGREAGDQVIEEHDELGEGSAHHEEVYLVLAGHARFTVDERVIEAPAGTLVLVPDPESRRAAIAVAPATTVVVVGGRPGAALPAAPYEHWFAAEPAYVAGRYDEAYAIAAEGLVDWPDHGHLNYQLACYASLAGRTAEALEHLRRAFRAAPEQVAEWAADDSDLDPLRALPGWPGNETSAP